MVNMASELFKDKGIQIGNIKHLSPKETFELCDKGAYIVDVREEYETVYKQFDVQNIIYLPNTILKENINQLPKDKALIFADSVGLRSKQAVEFLIEQGYENIANLNGGIVDWEMDKLPMKINPDEAISGSCMCTMRTKRDWEGK